MRRSREILIGIILLCPAALTTTGCVAWFRGGKLPDVTYADLAQGRAIPAVDYEYSGYFVLPGAPKDPPPQPGLPNMEIDYVLRTSGLFERVSFGSGERYHFKFAVRIQEDRTTTFLTTIPSTLTLFILPSITPRHYTMDAELYRDGRLLKAGKYEDTLTCWIQLFLLFSAQHYPMEGQATRLQENMVLSFLRDAQREGLLAPPAGPAASAPGLP